MRSAALILLGALGVLGMATSAKATPTIPFTGQNSNIIAIAEGCGPGWHLTPSGCVPNRHDGYRTYGYYHHGNQYPFYGGGFDRDNRNGYGYGDDRNGYRHRDDRNGYRYRDDRNGNGY